MNSRLPKYLALTLTAVLLVSVIVAASMGQVRFSLADTFMMLWDTVVDSVNPEGRPWERSVLVYVRLPRVVLAALGGCGLAAAGTVMQGVFRNPMADPGVLGISAGAALGAVAALYLSPVALSPLWIALSAFLGALGCAFLVYVLSTFRGQTPVVHLLLAGIAVGGIASALTSLLLSLSLSEWEVGREMLAWLMGGLDGRSWTHVALCAPPLVGDCLLLLLFSSDLNALATGEEHALAVGVDVIKAKRDLIMLSSLVTAAAVAVMGVVGFVGLIVPHIVRLLVGPDHRKVLPLSALTGAIMLVWADLLCRSLPTGELRLGVVTALAGGPFFLVLLIRQRGRTGFR